jgi:hypothetical protein
MHSLKTAEEIKKYFGPLLGDDAFLLADAAEQIVKWLQTADPALISDALDLMVTGGVVKKFAELFRSSNPNLAVSSPLVHTHQTRFSKFERVLLESSLAF